MLFIAIWNGPSDLIPQFKNIDIFFYSYAGLGCENLTGAVEKPACYSLTHFTLQFANHFHLYDFDALFQS